MFHKVLEAAGPLEAELEHIRRDHRETERGLINESAITTHNDRKNYHKNTSGKSFTDNTEMSNVGSCPMYGAEGFTDKTRETRQSGSLQACMCLTDT